MEQTFNMEKDDVQLSDELAETMKVGQEMAIIGYWKRTSESPNSEFKCYHFFYLPNPQKREIRRSNRDQDNINMKGHAANASWQVLYRGNIGGDREEIFLFFNEPVDKTVKTDKTEVTRLAILNCEPNDDKKRFEWNDRDYESLSHTSLINIKFHVELPNFPKKDSIGDIIRLLHSKPVS